MTPHVSDAEIEGFSRRELPPDALIRVADHLVECPECQKRALAGEPSPGADKRVLEELLAMGPHVLEEEIHAYVDRRLSGRRRAEIERHLASCPSCTAEIRDLQAFAGGMRVASHRRVWSYAAIAAAAAVLLIGIVRTVAWRQSAPRQTLAQREQAQPRAAEVTVPGVAPSTAESGQQGSGAASSTPPLRSMPASIGTVTLALNVRPVRSVDTSAPPTVIIGEGIHELVVRLTLREIDYPRYQLILRSGGGAQLFSKPDLQPQNGQSAPILVVSVPAETLPAGHYILTLKGEDRAGQVEDVSTSFFRVQRK